MDGVLVDVSRSYRRATEETAAHFTGRAVPPGRIQEYKNRGGFNDDWKLTYTLIQDEGVTVPFETVVEAFQMRYQGRNFDGFIADEVPIFSTETLEALRCGGMAMGIVTGRPADEALWTVRHNGWQDLFPVVIAADHQEGRGKPDPYGIELALAALKAMGKEIQALEAVYVGDTVDDIAAALAAGMGAIGIVPPYLDYESHRETLLRHGAHLVLRDASELPQAVGL